MPTTKQLAALKDLQRAAGMTDDQWTAKFGDMSDQQLAVFADSTMATPVFHRKMNEFDAQLKAKDAEIAQKKAEMDASYTAEINRLGQIATTVQQTGGQGVAAYQAKLKEVQGRYGLTDDEVQVDVQTAQFQQQQNPYQQPYQQQQAQQPAATGFITEAQFKQALAESQAANANMLAGTIKRNNEFSREFGETLDIDRVLSHASTYGVDVDTAINEVYDVPAKRAAKAKADEDARFSARLAEERKTWEQSRATEGLFDPNAVAPSMTGQKSIWNIKTPDVPVVNNGQVNVSDPQRLSDQARRGMEVLARLNS